MLCLPGDVPLAIQKIQSAIANKVLDSIDIDNRVKKVLLAKYNLGLADYHPVVTDSLYKDLNKDVQNLKRKIARNAFTLLRLKDTALFPLHQGKKIAYVGIGSTDTSTVANFLFLENGADVFNYNYYDDTPALMDTIEKKLMENMMLSSLVCTLPANTRQEISGLQLQLSIL